MFDVVVVSILKFLKLAEDGFHILSEGYLCGASVFDVGEDFLLLMVDPSSKGRIP